MDIITYALCKKYTDSNKLTQVDTYEDLPETGSEGAIYLVKGTGQSYYWDTETETYITVGTAGRTGVYTTSQNLPATVGQSIEINKTDLSVIVAPSVPYFEGSEIVGANAVYGVITSIQETKVAVKTIMNSAFEAFRQYDAESDLPVIGTENVLYAIKSAKSLKAWDNDLNIYYNLPEITMDEDFTVECEQGDYKVNDVITEGTPILTIIKKMLTKTIYPTFTAPSATMTSTGGQLLECGSTLNTTFTVTFNQGAISPEYGTNGKRAGAANGYKLNNGTSQVGNTFTRTISESDKGPFTATVSYDEGPQPKDSHGENYSSPLAAGSVNSNQIKYEFVNALYANVEDIATISKLPLISKSSELYIFDFPAQTVENPVVFDIPETWTITAIEVYNEFNQQ